MSFAEFGSGQPQRPASAPTSANSYSASSSGGATGSKSGLEVISETLLQYQVCVIVILAS